MKRAMSLEEDFRCNPSLDDTGKKQWPFGSPQNKGQGQESKETSEGEQSFGKGKNASSQANSKKNCNRCGKHHEGQHCASGIRLCYICK
nr:hypothetical protein CFP56_76211 [Quercus suber]